jgi:hypothetical protein
MHRKLPLGGRPGTEGGGGRGLEYIHIFRTLKRPCHKTELEFLTYFDIAFDERFICACMANFVHQCLGQNMS